MSSRLRDDVTMDSLLQEVEQVRQLALADNDYKTALSCTMSKVKLFGGGRIIENREQQRNDPLRRLYDVG